MIISVYAESFSVNIPCPSHAEWQSICMIALTRLEHVCECVANGNISIHDIGLLQGYQNQVSKLLSTQPIESFQLLNSVDLYSYVGTRDSEYQHFLKFQAELMSFIFRLEKNVPIKGNLN